MFDKTRRTLLKGLGYGSAITAAGASGAALANSSDQASKLDLTSLDVHLLPTQHAKTETLNLFNHTDADITIDGIDHVSLDSDGGMLAIRVNKNGQRTTKDSITLSPWESHEFVVSTNSSDYRGIKPLSTELPVTIFDSQAA